MQILLAYKLSVMIGSKDSSLLGSSVLLGFNQDGQQPFFRVECLALPVAQIAGSRSNAQAYWNWNNGQTSGVP
jgi:hypothetical protein